ncbi:MAG: DUF3788 domain-containing protein [Lactobacillaceae bacterium]|jgi:hypothetical protein|nr:DUF3788 domain-containing protein [Lactobacillaceae bacterium]
MSEKMPAVREIKSIIGDKPFEAWEAIVKYINDKYVMDILWDKGRKENIYEMKFRKSGKTLCAMYPRDKSFGFMIIYGRLEREKFENERSGYSKDLLKIYDAATTYHDGKWIMIDVKDMSYIEDIKNMLVIKKKPNRKI